MGDARMPLRLLAQVVVYAAIMAVVGYLSFQPAYTHLAGDIALLKLSFSHGAERKGECRRLSPEEIAALPANMRRPLDCPRERLPVVVELVLDGELLHREVLPPSGIAGDGPSTVYRRFQLSAGEHHLVARLRDTNRDSGFDYEAERTVRLAPRQNWVVDFRAETGGFLFY